MFNYKPVVSGFKVKDYVNGLSATGYDNNVGVFVSNFRGNNQLINKLLTEI